MTEYDVKREHYGDKYYQTGDKRSANPSDVKHLVDNGVLVEVASSAKSKTAKSAAK